MESSIGPRPISTGVGALARPLRHTSEQGHGADNGADQQARLIAELEKPYAHGVHDASSGHGSEQVTHKLAHFVSSWLSIDLFSQLVYAETSF